MDFTNTTDPSRPAGEVHVRRSLTSDSNRGDGYQTLNHNNPHMATFTNGVPTPAPIISTNSVNVEFLGTAPTQPVPRSDKIPLLNVQGGMFMRSLSGIGNVFQNTRSDGLSTFAGCMAPVALSMFSALLFLRMGYVVGQSGVLVTLAQLLLAYLILLNTVLSLCAVSTNGAIEGGGVYYMISRALGPEFGGAIGVLFFVANVFSCALYTAGFREVLLSNFGPGGDSVAGAIPGGRWWAFCYDFFSTLFLLGMCLVGAAMFAKAAVVVFVIVMFVYGTFLISLMVHNGVMAVPIPDANHGDNLTNIEPLYTGVRYATFHENLKPNYGIDYTTKTDATFAVVFAVIFSGVTGIMAGANVSGDLKRPSYSIPRGTLGAVCLTFIVYFLTTFLIGASCSNDLLKNNYTVMQNINVWPPFIVIGLFSATLFSAMSNMLGASRILARVAEDKLFGFLLYPATINVCNSNPIMAVAISWVLVVLVLLIGAFNEIAQITSIFFLLSYAGVNLACLALDLASAPNFRPTFKYFNWQTSLLGFLGCIAMMFVVNAVFTGVAIILLLLLIMGLHYMAPLHGWGSISQALIFHQVRKYLLLLDSRKEHVKFWRPHILLMVANPKSCAPLIDFANDMKKSGLYMLGHVKLGRFDECAMDPTIEDMPFWLGMIDYMKIKAFVEITVAPSVREGAQHLIRLAGIGAMKPNTVMLGFYDDTSPQDTFGTTLWKRKKFAKLDQGEIDEFFSVDLRGNQNPGAYRPLSPIEYVHILHDILRQNKNFCLARGFGSLDKQAAFKGTPGAGSFIDVWPVDIVRPNNPTWGFDNSCLFLLQLACILNMNRGWKRTKVRVFLCVTSLEDIKLREQQLQEMLGVLRIHAKTVMVPWDHVICEAAENAAEGHASASVVDERPINFTNAPEAYLRSMNETIRRFVSPQSAVLFLNAPPPPAAESSFLTYLQCLSMLSEGLPPTMLVHGIASVISTAL